MTEPTLLDWRRRIADLYHEVRASGDPVAAWGLWRRTRDKMFSAHPQSPLPMAERQGFSGCEYFPYDPAYRTTGCISHLEPEHYEIRTSGDGTYGFTRLGKVSFELNGAELELEVYWLDGYGGGLFLPFRDGTSGRETYGAGRYLLDTAKGADLGSHGEDLVLDFNFAYNPSCSYDPQWVCPLAPPPNRLAVPIEAGEKHVARDEGAG